MTFDLICSNSDILDYTVTLRVDLDRVVHFDEKVSHTQSLHLYPHTRSRGGGGVCFCEATAKGREYPPCRNQNWRPNGMHKAFQNRTNL